MSFFTELLKAVSKKKIRPKRSRATAALRDIRKEKQSTLDKVETEVETEKTELETEEIESESEAEVDNTFEENAQSELTFDKIIPERLMRIVLRAGPERFNNEISNLQFYLKNFDDELKITGVFDEQTESAVLSFQTNQGLVVDGIVGRQSWLRLIELVPLRDEPELYDLTPRTPMLSSSEMTDRMVRTWLNYQVILSAVAKRLEVHPAALLAVLMVESSGNAYDYKGRAVIRFENHIFWRYWGKNNKAIFDKHFKFGVDRVESWKGHWFKSEEWEEMHVSTNHATQDLEYEAFSSAMTLDKVAAIKSTSFGLGQVIGFNASQAGYEDLDHFQDDMHREDLQIFAMIEFIRNGRQLLDALWSLDFVAFAREYNGSGQPEWYGNKMKQRYDEAVLCIEDNSL